MNKHNPDIQYKIFPVNPAAHLFHVTCVVAKPDPQGQQFWLPAWLPGSYMIRDFARNIVELRAHSGQQAVAVSKLDKQTWQCAPCSAELIIEYTVYAWDLSVRGAHLDETHGFFNGSSVFVAIGGQENQAVSVEILPPAGDQYRDWRVATALTAQQADYAFGHFSATDYDELIDHPVEMGAFALIEFTAGNIPHAIVISGRHKCNQDRLRDDVQRICETHIRMFGELPPIKKYLFLLMVVENGYGGLEHRSSTSLLCSWKDLPAPAMPSLTDDYITLLGLFSHEYFHTWNVKAIKPAEFTPYQLKDETYTRQLWAYEGITSYYDELGLLRSGCINLDQYLTLLGKNITRVIRGQGRFKQSLTESSFDAWTKFYKQDENAPNAIVSYYVKGGLFAMCLDMKLRLLSDDKVSLDTVMQQLWRQYGKTATGTDENTLLTICNRLTNTSLDEFFSTYLSSTEDLPLAALLTQFDLQYLTRAPLSSNDAGGNPVKAEQAMLPFNLGVRFQDDPAGAKIQILFSDGCLQNAGLASGDIIIAVDGLKTTTANIESILRRYNVNDSLVCHFFRRNQLLQRNIILTAALNDTAYLQVTPDSAQKKYLQWLQAATGA